MSTPTPTVAWRPHAPARTVPRGTSRNRTARLALPVAVLTLALTACGNAPERAVTVGTESPAAKVAENTKAAPKPKGAGDKLNAKQVKAALLGVGDMPTGWAAAKPEPEKDDTSTVEPA